MEVSHECFDREQLVRAVHLQCCLLQRVDAIGGQGSTLSSSGRRETHHSFEPVSSLHLVRKGATLCEQDLVVLVTHDAGAYWNPAIVWTNRFEGIPLRGILRRAMDSCDCPAAAVPTRTLGADGPMLDTGVLGMVYLEPTGPRVYNGRVPGFEIAGSSVFYLAAPLPWHPSPRVQRRGWFFVGTLLESHP